MADSGFIGQGWFERCPVRTTVGAESHADRVKFFEEPDEHLERPGEAIDPLDEQGVVEAEASVAQPLLKGGSFGVGAGELAV
jgi:hypothetical protein